MIRRLLPLLVLISLVASACQVRFDSAIEVRDDESGTFSIDIGFDEEFRQLAEQQGGDLDFSTATGDIPAGWSTSSFTDGEFEGTRITTEFSDLADLQAKLRQLEETGGDEAGTPNALIDAITLERSGDTFRFETTLEQVDEQFADLAGGGELQGLDPSAFLESLFQVRFLVTLPGTIGDHNADVVDGNTLIWRIRLDGQSRTLSATSTTSGGLSLGTIVPIAAAALIVGVGAVLFIRRRGVTTDTEAALASITVSQPIGRIAAEDTGPIDGDPFSS